jgi:DNA-binding winged helix-turn-helix (wHTH) protein
MAFFRRTLTVVWMRTVVQTAGDSHVELARQVRELRVALATDDDAIQVVRT